MDKSDRFALLVEAMVALTPASTFEEARFVLEMALNGIEDRHSGVPYNQATSHSDGRMYPPHDDFEKPSGIDGVRVFKTRGHRVFFALNGAIRIESVTGEVVLDKPGKDGGICPR